MHTHTQSLSHTHTHEHGDNCEQIEEVCVCFFLWGALIPEKKGVCNCHNCSCFICFVTVFIFGRLFCHRPVARLTHSKSVLRDLIGCCVLSLPLSSITVLGWFGSQCAFYYFFFLPLVGLMFCEHGAQQRTERSGLLAYRNDNIFFGQTELINSSTADDIHFHLQLLISHHFCTVSSLFPLSFLDSVSHLPKKG